MNEEIVKNFMAHAVKKKFLQGGTWSKEGGGLVGGGLTSQGWGEGG